MKRISSLAIGGALVVALLSGCSSAVDPADFCDTANSWANGDGPDLADLSDDALTNASAGDMSGINEWGKTAGAQVDGMVADLKRAQAAAPSDEASKAIDVVFKGMDAVKVMTDGAATAKDYDSFISAMTKGSDAAGAIDQELSDASDVLDKATQEACS